MRRMMIVFAVMCIAGLAACSSAPPKPDANYAAYLDLVRDQQRADEQRIAGIAQTASACNDARCVEHVAAVAALAAAGGGNRPMPQPYKPEPSMGKQIALALVGQISPLASAAVNWHQADTSARTAEAQYRYLDNVLSAAVGGMASVARNATPSITVGGNYGNTYGNDYTGGDRTDVAGNLVNGNGNVFGDRNFNSGRQDSAGPFDRTCSGDGCQPAITPDSDPDP